MRNSKFYSIILLGLTCLLVIGCKKKTPVPTNQFEYNDTEYEAYSAKLTYFKNLNLTDTTYLPTDSSELVLKMDFIRVADEYHNIKLNLNLQIKSPTDHEMENGAYAISEIIEPFNIYASSMWVKGGINLLSGTETYFLNIESGSVDYDVNDGEGTINVNFLLSDETELVFSYTGLVEQPE